MVLYVAPWRQHDTTNHFFVGPRQPHCSVACQGGDERHDLCKQRGRHRKQYFLTAGSRVVYPHTHGAARAQGHRVCMGMCRPESSVVGCVSVRMYVDLWSDVQISAGTCQQRAYARVRGCAYTVASICKCAERPAGRGWECGLKK